MPCPPSLIPPLLFPSKCLCQNHCLPRTRLVHFLSRGLQLFFAVLQHEVRCADREKTVQGINTQAAGVSGHPVSAQPDPALLFGAFPALHTSCFSKG